MRLVGNPLAMSKEDTIEALAEILGALIFLALLALGIKYAFDFTWFQAAMIVFVIDYIKGRKK